MCENVDKNVIVLISAFNGELYLRQCLDSIISQSFHNIKIVIRDDGSSDQTVSILEEYKKNYENIVLLYGENVGVIHSFEILLDYAIEHTKSNYFMFADQDDIWLQTKITKSFDNMKDMEKKYGDIPLLTHTDLMVVDRNLKRLSPSFWKFQSINPRKDKLNYLLVQNVITGCTIMVNRELAKRALPFPTNVIMHDWWLGLVASALGKIDYVNEATILYRQHGNNTIGAKKLNARGYIKKFYRSNLQMNISQASALLMSFNTSLKIEQKGLVQSFINLENLSPIGKITNIFRNKFFKSSLFRNIGLILLMLRNNKRDD